MYDNGHLSDKTCDTATTSGSMAFLFTRGVCQRDYKQTSIRMEPTLGNYGCLWYPLAGRDDGHKVADRLDLADIDGEIEFLPGESE